MPNQRDVNSLPELDVESISIYLNYDRRRGELTHERSFAWSLHSTHVSTSGTTKPLYNGHDFSEATITELFCAAAALENLYLALRAELKLRKSHLNLTMTHVVGKQEIETIWQQVDHKLNVEPSLETVEKQPENLSKFDALV
jgi:hypothetical protein